MKAFYSDRYVIPLPPQHRFPIVKYALIRQRLDDEGVLKAHQLVHPPLVERDEALLVHTPDYYDRLVAGQLTEREIRRLGLPWSEALVGRVESLRALSAEIESASAGKAFLLRKKLDDERKRASREAEQQVVAEIEREVIAKLSCDTVSESRIERDGAFPQINVLIDRDEESRLQELHASLNDRYAADGVALAITGPWPPYTFAHV